MKSKQSITHFSEVKVWFNFKASPINLAPSSPILLLFKLKENSINEIKSQQLFEHTYSSDFKVWLNFKASPIDLAPSTPILFWPKLTRVVNKPIKSISYFNEVKVEFIINASPRNAAVSSSILAWDKLKWWDEKDVVLILTEMMSDLSLTQHIFSPSLLFLEGTPREQTSTEMIYT